MKKIIVASKNPVKLNATLTGFQKMFPDESFEVEGISVSSGVSDQPKTNIETYQGALNRLHRASEAFATGDFWVGIEGGIEENGSDIEAFAWVCIKSNDGIFGKGKTGVFYLPERIAELVRQGKELGEADDIVFGTVNSKQANGAIGFLTNDTVDRTKYYTDAVTFALIPFKHQHLY